MKSEASSEFSCIIHGSFGKHFSEIQEAARLFESVGIEVLAPKSGELVEERDGFGLFEDEVGEDPRLIELMYLHNLKKLGLNGFSYFVNPGGYVGKSASYELGIAQLTNTKCFFMEDIDDHPAYLHANSVWTPEKLTDYIVEKERLPEPVVHPDESKIHKLWNNLMVPGSVVAAGAIIEHDRGKSRNEKEILLVKTHKWKDRYSVVGGKVRRNEKLKDALHREIHEETGLKGEIGRHLATFDQIKNSGYYNSSVHHVFVDNVFTVKSKKVRLNEEAQDYLWVRPSDALEHLDIEPNARHIVDIYSRSN